MPCTLVTGASGLVGHRLMQALAETPALCGLYHSRKPAAAPGRWVRSDLRDRSEGLRLLDELRPEVIIHCAALSDPVFCEEHPREANELNFGATLWISGWAEANGCHLIHLSTDLVFDGLRGDYREEDPPRPVSVYGWTKLAAELAVRTRRCSWAIVRPSLIYGRSAFGDHSAEEKLLACWREDRPTKLFLDEYRNPTAVGELAAILEALVRSRDTGIWHVAGAQCMSRFDFGSTAARIFGVSESLLVPVRIAEVRSLPPRAPNTTLNIEKIRSRFPLEFDSIEANLRREYRL